MIDQLPEYLTIHVLAHECNCGECAPGPVVEIPTNGPFGDSEKGFRLWVEYFPS